jgi:eukaryotic-like serine/threonine-protein kinase
VAIASALDLYESLRMHRLLEPAQLALIKRMLQDQPYKPQQVAHALLKKGWLTEYQQDLLLQGRGAELILQEYILLEQLGEGATGKVFKARHRLMDRIVAIKVIRKELTADRDAVQRFEREIRLAAKLDHAHLVHALDAAHVGNTYFLVMEYAEGIDLERFVQQSGRLQVGQACDFICQAALGLQHASELGLVHRDIKPSNLQLTAQGTTIKILDVGLARLMAGGTEKAQPTMTRVCSFMGTPDFVAPEQIDDPSRVDVRADIYSLGCTFYFLLAGRPPFPVEEWGEKLASHRRDEPQSIEQLRTDVPAPVAAVLRKMMAKRPENRYVTASAVADALAPFSKPTSPSPTSTPRSSGPLLTQPTQYGQTPSTNSTVIPTGPTLPPRTLIAQQAPQLVAQRALRPSQPPPLPSPVLKQNFRRRRIRFWLVRTVCGLAGLGILSMLVFWLKGDSKPVIDEYFRDAHEKKLNVPEGWTEGDAFRIDKDNNDQTFLEVAGEDPSIAGGRRGRNSRSRLAPFVRLPTVHLSGNFYIEGVVLLPRNYHWEGTLTFRLEDPQNRGNTLAVVIHGNGSVNINDDVATPLQGYRPNVPTQFLITRKGTQISVLLNGDTAHHKDLGTVANFERIKLGLSAGNNNGAGSNKLYQLTVGTGEHGAIPGPR